MTSGGAARRALAIVLLFMTGPMTYAAAVCGGWSHKAVDRMACCQAAAGHCAAISADDCCASGEQRRNLEGVAVVSLPADSDRAGTLLIATPLRRQAVETVHRAVSGRPDTYLLDSVFLI